MISKIVSGMIVIFVGVSLLPEFANGRYYISKPEEKPHRQTYEEYVRERLSVERMMHKT